MQTHKPPPSPDPVFVYRGHTADINAVKFSFSGDKLFSGSADGEIRVWGTSSKKCMYASKIHDQGILSLLPLQNNRLLSQGKDGMCKIWQIANSNIEMLQTIQTDSFSFGKCAVYENSEGDIIASPSAIDPSRIEIWDVKSQQVTQSIGTEAEKLGLCMYIKYMPEAPNILCVGYENGKIHWWDVRTGQMLFSKSLHSEPVMCFDLDPSMHTGVSGAADSKICIFNYELENGKCEVVKEIALKNAGIQDVKVREDKKIFATAGWDHRVRVYNWKKHTPLAILLYHTEGVYALDFSPMSTPGGSLLASASKDKKIAVWSLYNK